MGTGSWRRRGRRRHGRLLRSIRQQAEHRSELHVRRRYALGDRLLRRMQIVQTEHSDLNVMRGTARVLRYCYGALPELRLSYCMRQQQLQGTGRQGSREGRTRMRATCNSGCRTQGSVRRRRRITRRYDAGYRTTSSAAANFSKAEGERRRPARDKRRNRTKSRKNDFQYSAIRQCRAYLQQVWFRQPWKGRQNNE